MAATKEEVDGWIADARRLGYKYIISVCDTFKFEDYPVYFKTEKEMLEKSPDYEMNMQKINEIIKVEDLPDADNPMREAAKDLDGGMWYSEHRVKEIVWYFWQHDCDNPSTFLFEYWWEKFKSAHGFDPLPPVIKDMSVAEYEKLINENL